LSPLKALWDRKDKDEGEGVTPLSVISSCSSGDDGEVDADLSIGSQVIIPMKKIGESTNVPAVLSPFSSVSGSSHGDFPQSPVSRQIFEEDNGVTLTLGSPASTRTLDSALRGPVGESRNGNVEQQQQLQQKEQHQESILSDKNDALQSGSALLSLSTNKSNDSHSATAKNAGCWADLGFGRILRPSTPTTPKPSYSTDEDSDHGASGVQCEYAGFLGRIKLDIGGGDDDSDMSSSFFPLLEESVEHVFREDGLGDHRPGDVNAHTVRSSCNALWRALISSV